MPDIPLQSNVACSVQSIVPKNKGGRPKGTKNKVARIQEALPLGAMTIQKRLRILQSIALDTSAKPNDRIAAIKLMTDILSDKVIKTSDGLGETQIKFESKEIVGDAEKTLEKPIIEPSNTPKEVPSNIPMETVVAKVVNNTTTTTTTTCVNNEQGGEQGGIVFVVKE